MAFSQAIAHIKNLLNVCDSEIIPIAGHSCSFCLFTRVEYCAWGRLFYTFPVDSDVKDFRVATCDYHIPCV
jgi:hypothetical protein